MGEVTLKSAKVIGGMVAAAITHVQASDPLVHEAAVQTCAHAEKHGDWTLLHRLMVGLKASGYRYQGVRVWIEAFTPLRFPADRNSDGGFTVKVLKPTDDGFTAWNIAGLNETPFTSFEPARETTGKPVYADDFVSGLLRSKARFLRLLQNTNADGTAKDDTKPFYRGDVAAMLTYLSAVEAINVPEDRTKVEDEKRQQREAETAVIASILPAKAQVPAAAGTPVVEGERDAA